MTNVFCLAFKICKLHECYPLVEEIKFIIIIIITGAIQDFLIGGLNLQIGVRFFNFYLIFINFS